MNNWFCIKDNVILNKVHATEEFMQTDAEIKTLYDSYINADTLGQPQARIGSYLEEGVWKNNLTDLTNRDYSNQTVTEDFAYCDLTGANFNGADITNAKFCDAEGSFSLVGALWNGNVVSQEPIRFLNPYYYCFVTDVFTVMGCVTMPTADVAGMSPQEASGSDTSHPDKPSLFWQHIQDAFLALLNSWGM
jgi:hypothetical protein